MTDVFSRTWLADQLMRRAARRMRRRHPDWAAAMVAEGEALVSGGERLAWAAGCLDASYRAAETSEAALYAPALLVGVGGMILYQWSADESLVTLVVLALICLALGALSPRRLWLSALPVGLVVAAVNVFETLTGVHPAYETARHGLAHNLRWVVLVAPALMAVAAGRFARSRLGGHPLSP